MATRERHLRNAPIIEAVIDLHAAPPDGKTFADFRQTFGGLDFGYEQTGLIATGSFGIKIDTESDQIAQARVGPSERIGLRFESNGGKYVAQLRTTGFSLSRLEPYESWEKLRDEAARVWRAYLEHWKPTLITRVATRYINNLRLPLGQGDDLGIYIDTLTELPPALPQHLTGFLQRFSIREPGQRFTTLLTLMLDGLPVDGRVPILFDIDIFTEERFPVEGEAAWQCLEDLRALKNRCFFGTLTDKAMELYE